MDYHGNSLPSWCFTRLSRKPPDFVHYQRLESGLTEGTAEDVYHSLPTTPHSHRRVSTTEFATPGKISPCDSKPTQGQCEVQWNNSRGRRPESENGEVTADTVPSDTNTGDYSSPSQKTVLSGYVKDTAHQRNDREVTQTGFQTDTLANLSLNSQSTLSDDGSSVRKLANSSPGCGVYLSPLLPRKPQTLSRASALGNLNSGSASHTDQCNGPCNTSASLGAANNNVETSRFVQPRGHLVHSRSYDSGYSSSSPACQRVVRQVADKAHTPPATVGGTGSNRYNTFQRNHSYRASIATTREYHFSPPRPSGSVQEKKSASGSTPQSSRRSFLTRSLGDRRKIFAKLPRLSERGTGTQTEEDRTVHLRAVKSFEGNYYKLKTRQFILYMFSSFSKPIRYV